MPRARTAPAPTSGTRAGVPLGRRWVPGRGPARPTACGLAAWDGDFSGDNYGENHGTIHEHPENRGL